MEDNFFFFSAWYELLLLSKLKESKPYVAVQQDQNVKQGLVLVLSLRRVVAVFPFLLVTWKGESNGISGFQQMVCFVAAFKASSMLLPAEMLI